MLCGDTSVAAPDFRTHIFMLKKADPSTGKTGFNDQLEVSLLSLGFNVVLHSHIFSS